MIDQRHVDGRAGSQSMTARRGLAGNPSYIQMPFRPTGTVPPLMAPRCAEELSGRDQMSDAYIHIPSSIYSYLHILIPILYSNALWFTTMTNEDHAPCSRFLFLIINV